MPITVSAVRPPLAEDNLSPLAKLMAGIVAAVSELDQENLFDLADQLVLRFGSVEAALAAVEAGDVRFKVGE
jgi:hypothetical protein